MIVIVDYGMGNLGSVANMLAKCGATAVISRDAELIQNSDKLILAGVGAFDRAMDNLNDLGLVKVLNTAVRDHRKPVLGLCLGMQLMTEGSEEGAGNTPGLGWVKARTQRFNFSSLQSNDQPKIPHMGWNNVDILKESPLLKYWEQDMRFYFAHSYHVVGLEKQFELLGANYGYEFVAAFEQEHIAGVQFHPEKSHSYGQLLLKSFAELE